MKRIIENGGTVHYAHPAYPSITLCGMEAETVVPGLFGGIVKHLPETHERVTCTACARVVCAVRNEPYNTLVAEITGTALREGMFSAVVNN